MINAEANNSSRGEFARLLHRIEEFEIWVNGLRVPTFEAEKYFNLKAHTDILRNRVRTKVHNKE